LIKPILEVNNLKIGSKDVGKPLVDGISFVLNPGEVLALVGESGSGKSITALSIMRLLPNSLFVTEGNIMLEAKNLFRLTEKQMNDIRGRRVSMIFQEPQTSLNPVQTIGYQIFEALRLHRELSLKEAESEVVGLLLEVGLPEAESRVTWYPHQLSGGQIQRVMIAIALASDPTLLVADEPTTALDVTVQKQILDLLLKLKSERDLSILFITHDLNVVADFADRVAVMHHGKLVEIAACGDFFNTASHPYSQKLLSCLPSGKTFLPKKTSASLLRVNNLHVWFPKRRGIFQRVYGYTKAVDGVSFEINKGETLALVGESGCGKTTTGRAILRLCSMTKGQISYENLVIQNLSNHEYRRFRRKIQIIFQDPFSSMNPRMTVGNIIQEGMRALTYEIPKKIRDRYLCEILDRVGLSEGYLSRYPHEFSGGQRQRIAIARALVVRPRLIICDEPTSALDVALRSEVLDLLRELQVEYDISYLFITHDLSLIPSFAHNVAVMKDGKIVEQGAAEDVFFHCEHEYSRKLVDSAPNLAIKPESIGNDE
jgi:ABC-type microcin C transport system duplicated ATPase subunit YejF